MKKIIKIAIQITTTVPKSGSKNIKKVIRSNIMKEGQNIFLKLLLFLYLLFKESHTKIISASLAISDGCILKKSKFIHLLELPITGLIPGIKTSASSPIEIRIRKMEIFE
jgi:hypothetical protein